MSKFILGLSIGVGLSALIGSLSLTASNEPPWELLVKHQPNGVDVKCVRDCYFETLKYWCGPNSTGCVAKLNARGVSGTHEDFEVEWPRQEAKIE